MDRIKSIKYQLDGILETRRKHLLSKLEDIGRMAQRAEVMNVIEKTLFVIMYLIVIGFISFFICDMYEKQSGVTVMVLIMVAIDSVMIYSCVVLTCMTKTKEEMIRDLDREAERFIEFNNIIV